MAILLKLDLTKSNREIRGQSLHSFMARISLSVEELAIFDAITFLWCNDHHKHAIGIGAFIVKKLIPVQQASPRLRIANDND